MKWILFTGTWRLTNEEVEKDVRGATREVMERGDGIVTGGATGVDYFAMDESMKIDPTASRLRVIIPANLKSYCFDYRTNWCNAPVTTDSINKLEALLREIQLANPAALIEMPHDIITQEHYNLRHDEEVKMADEVYAFQVNNSTGTQDTIDKASRAGLPVTLHKKYVIEEISISRATIEDAKDIAYIQEEGWLTTYLNEEHGISREDVLSKGFLTEENIERWKRGIEKPNTATWIAKEGNQSVGFCFIKEGEEINHIGALYVLSEFRNKGVGSQLMEKALAVLGRNKPVRLEVASFNKKAISFYERFGFIRGELIVQPTSGQLPSGAQIPEIEMVLPSV